MAALLPGVELKKYACPVCPRRFDSLGEKKRHIKRVHQQKPKADASE